MWFGLAVGYLYHFGVFSRIEMGVNRAARIERGFPFSSFAQQDYFITAGASMGGAILSTANTGGSARESDATTCASSTNFKAFSGKGQSIGGDPVRVPLNQQS